MALTPSQVQAEAQALFDELYAIFSRSPAHKAIMDDPVKAAMIGGALSTKLSGGWVPKKGFRTARAVARTAPPVAAPSLSRDEAKRYIAHVYEVFREQQARGAV